MRYVSIALLLMASTANAFDWQQIGQADSNGATHFIDATTITQVKNFRRAWFKSVYTSEQPVPTDYQAAFRKAKSWRWVESMGYFNCPGRTSAAAEFRWYDGKDKGVGNFHVDPLTFRRVEPGSAEEQMLDTVCKAEGVQQQVSMEAMAKMVRPMNPDDYYPAGSRRRGEQGAPIVQACVGASGEVLREPDIIESSGFLDLDAAAVRVAAATRYAAGQEGGVPLAESCIKFKVKFGPH